MRAELKGIMPEAEIERILIDETGFSPEQQRELMKKDKQSIAKILELDLDDLDDQRSKTSSHKYNVGEVVEGKYREKWYAASIKQLNPDGTYEIRWSAKNKRGNYEETKYQRECNIRRKTQNATEKSKKNENLIEGTVYQGEGKGQFLKRLTRDNLTLKVYSAPYSR